MQQVTLDSENYETFTRSISILKDICNDADIRDGIIRQRTNDKFSVFELDLSPIIGDMSIPLTNLKKKLDLFKIFAEQEVTLTTEDNKFTIGDQYSTLTFDYPDLDYLDNKWMLENELQNIFVMNEEDIVLTCDVSETISERIRIITGSFSVNTINVIFAGESAHLSTKTQSKDQRAMLISDIVTERIIEANSNLIATPFIIDHDGVIEFKMYNYEDNLCANKYTSSIGDVEIRVYGRSSLISEESGD